MTVFPLVRVATPADHAEILRVVNLAYRVEEFFVRGDRLTPSLLANYTARPTGAFLVLDAPPNKTLVGSVFVEARGGTGWFGMLAVDPARQGEGHARRLAAAAEAWCTTRGLARIELEVVDLRTELPAFYTRLGYAPTGRLPFPDPDKLTRPAAMIVMSKELA